MFRKEKHQYVNQDESGPKLHHRISMADSQQASSKPLFFNYSNQEKEEYFSTPTFSNSELNNDQDQFSPVSFQQNIMQEHLACLEDSILNFLDRNIEVLNGAMVISQFQLDCNDQEQQLEDYLLKRKSLIPNDQMRILLEYLKLNRHLRETLQWIYDRVSPKFGDELILAAHRILLAYLPVKHLMLTAQQIQLISTTPFNIYNILNCPSYRLFTLTPHKISPVLAQKYQSEVFTFLGKFISTMLLILENFFQNPLYSKIKIKSTSNNEQVKSGSPVKKSKKIKKGG